MIVRVDRGVIQKRNAAITAPHDGVIVGRENERSIPAGDGRIRDSLAPVDRSRIDDGIIADRGGTAGVQRTVDAGGAIRFPRMH